MPPHDAQVEIAPATESDVPTILRFIRELADYEKLSHDVVAGEADLRRTLFGERGVGRALLGRLARLAVERDCGRLEWWVLDWNEDAIGFYRKLGAEAMDEWTVFRLAGSPLRKLAAEDG